MATNLYFVYDDSLKLPHSIEAVVGSRSFGHIIHKRMKLRDKIWAQLRALGIEQLVEIKHPQERGKVISRFKEEATSDSVFIHFFSKAVIIDPDRFATLIEKLRYCQNTGTDQEIDPFMLVFPSISEYDKYIQLLDKHQTVSRGDLGADSLLLRPDGFAMDISDIAPFLRFFSGGFEARYFNQILGDDHALVKRSTDQRKIQMEYEYYWLLPEPMKKWFVMPYDFKNEVEHASYAMERLNVPDMALQWIHNSVSLQDLSTFLDKIFTFIADRPARTMSKEAYVDRFESLYLKKVVDRMDKLKQSEIFPRLNAFVLHGTGHTFEQLMDEYRQLYHRCLKAINEHREVIGHGDLCFSNILYDRNSYLMKFIDPKGALTEEQLWTDPCYDLAKLSHSIMGNYDFINNDLFTVSLDDSFCLQLSLQARPLGPHQKLFVDRAEQAGFDVRVIRLCELSLFLSMLPLHVDHPRKVLGFVLNALHIKKELEQNLN